MKKLIEEIETLKTKSTPVQPKFERVFCNAIDQALQIVKSHDPWIGVSELPPLDSFMSNANISIDVLLTDGVSCVVGYYDFDEGKWFSDGYEYTFTHWTYLPEVKP